MTGVLNMALAPSIGRVTITLATLGANQYGEASSAIAMRGATLFYIDYLSAVPQVRLQLQPVLSQSFFRRLKVEDGVAGTFQTFTSASATYSEIGGTTSQWIWTPATLWAAGDVGETKKIIFEF